MPILANGQGRDFAVWQCAGRCDPAGRWPSSAFFTLVDESGPIQLSLRRATLARRAAGPARKLRPAHPLGCRYILDRGAIISPTDKGELSVKVERWEFLPRRWQRYPTNGMAGRLWKKRYPSLFSIILSFSPQTREDLSAARAKLVKLQFRRVAR